MNNRDLLDQAIDACEILKNIEYKITIGKNNTKMDIVLSFPMDRFHHMLGFHKAKDINLLNNQIRNRERIYKIVLANQGGVRDKIANSIFIKDIAPRLHAICELEKFLDHNKEAYYSKSNYFNDFNGIPYDFAIHVKEDAIYMTFYFIKEVDSNDQAKFIMVSTFEKEKPIGHCRRPHTLLKKIKINKATGKNELLFDYEKEKKS